MLGQTFHPIGWEKQPNAEFVQFCHNDGLPNHLNWWKWFSTMGMFEKSIICLFGTFYSVFFGKSVTS